MMPSMPVIPLPSTIPEWLLLTAVVAAFIALLNFLFGPTIIPRLHEYYKRRCSSAGDQQPPIEPDDKVTKKSKPPLGKIINLPYSRNLNFSGRKDLLSALRSALMEGQNVALTQAQAITGLGGVGKTQLALEYAYKCMENYQIIWWIRSEDPTTLKSDYADLAHKLGLVEPDFTDLDAIAETARSWLENNPGWLLIFDNAQNPEPVKEILPRRTPGHIIITSRNPDWAGLARLFPVTVFDRNESVKFLTTRTGQNDLETADRIAEALGDLPLALEQAGAYMVAKSARMREYLELFQNRRRMLWGAQPAPADYRDKVDTTWSLAMDAVQSTEGAGDLLNLISFLAPEDIPRDLLVKGKGQLPEPLASVIGDSIKLGAATEALSRYSLIDQEIERDSISVHRLVQMVTRDQLGADLNRWSKAAVMMMSEVINFDQNDMKTWQDSLRLSPHALSVAGHAESIAPKETSLILNHAGLALRHWGQFLEAKQALERALKIDEKVYGPDHPDVAIDVNNLGGVLKDLGDLQGAKKCFERSLKIFQNKLGEVHPSIKIVANNLNLVSQNRK